MYAFLMVHLCLNATEINWPLLPRMHMRSKGKAISHVHLLLSSLLLMPQKSPVPAF